MKINKYIKMHVEKYLLEIIKEYITNRNIKTCKRCKNVYRKISEILMF